MKNRIESKQMSRISFFGKALSVGILFTGSSVFGQVSEYSLNSGNPSGVITSESSYKNGFLDIAKAPYNATPNVNTSAVGAANTTAIQNAIDDAYTYDRAVFIPVGTFWIEDRLDCQAQLDGNSASKEDAFVITGDPAGGSILKIRGGNFASGPKAILNIWSEFTGSGNDPIEEGRPAKCYNHSVRDLEIHTNNKGGAVGIRFAAAQGCSIQNVKITATNSFAGIYNIPGRMGGVFDVDITGGKYGIYMPANGGSGNDVTAYGTICSVKLTNQTINSIYLNAGADICAVGVDIQRTNTNAAIVVAAGGADVSLIDSCIFYSGSLAAVAISKTNGSHLYMENVHIRKATKIVDNTSNDYTNPTTTNSKWTLVNGYEVGSSENFINGNDVALKDHTANLSISDPGQSHLDKHTMGDFPHWSDTGIDILGPGQEGQIQTKLDAAIGAKVFLKRGIYYVDSQILLGKDDKLFGASRVHTIIRPSTSFNPTAQKAIIQTSNQGGSKAGLAYLSVQMPRSKPDFTIIKWKAGANSTVRDVWTTEYSLGTAEQSKKHIRYILEGNGGGKWYMVGGNMNMMRANNPDTAMLKVASNKGQTLRIYALDAEHMAYSENGTVRVESTASNVYVYMFKAEVGSFTSEHPTPDAKAMPIHIDGASNVSMYNVTGLLDELEAGIPIVCVDNATNTVLSLIDRVGSGVTGSMWRVEEDGIHETSDIGAFIRD